MSLSEKQRIEKATAQLFLDLYNLKLQTHYVIQELSDTPDVICIDPDTGRRLELEISLLEDVPGDVAYILNRGPKPVSSSTQTVAASFSKDSVNQLESSLRKKLLSTYGADTALVLRQTSPLWEPKDWTSVAERFRIEILQGKERNFGAGVWIICADNSTWPSSEALFCLSDPVLK